MRPRDLLARFVHRTHEGTESKSKIRCSFCGLPHGKVKKLVSGPGVYICDACVELCVKIMAETDQPQH